MISTLFALALAALVLVVGMSLAFVVRLITGRSGWIDVLWSLSVGLAGEVALLTAEGGAPARRLLAAALIGVWSLRLVGHIARRSHGAADDPRYAALVAQWGPGWRGKLYGFLLAQAAAGVVLVLAVATAAANRAPSPGPLDALAVATAALALLGEAVADGQLARWRRTQKGASPGVCDLGLWRRSRHPNYFFEWLFWWCWPLLALDVSRPWAALAALAAPLMMGHLLVNVSGAPPLEAHMARTRGQAWLDYCARTPKFWPRLRRSR